MFSGELRRLGDDEMPLILSLIWSENGIKGLDNKQFVLKEKNSTDVQVRLLMCNNLFSSDMILELCLTGEW